MTVIPLKNGRHPKYAHLVYCNLEEHCGSYIITIDGQEGDALLSSEDAENLLGSDVVKDMRGYCSDEIVQLLEKEGV